MAGLAVGDGDHLDRGTGAAQQGQQPSHAEHLVVRVRREDDHPARGRGQLERGQPQALEERQPRRLGRPRAGDGAHHEARSTARAPRSARSRSAWDWRR